MFNFTPAKKVVLLPQSVCRLVCLSVAGLIKMLPIPFL